MATEWTMVTAFVLDRAEDESGVSGTGIVAVGVVLPSGRCVLEWLPGQTDVRSIGIYGSVDEVERVHGHGGKTSVRYVEWGGVDG